MENNFIFMIIDNHSLVWISIRIYYLILIVVLALNNHLFPPKINSVNAQSIFFDSREDSKIAT